MKLWALGLIGLGWFAHSWVSDNPTTTANWLKQQTTAFNLGIKDNNGDFFNKSSSSSTHSRSRHPIILAQEDTHRTDPSAEADHPVEDAIRWIWNKSEKNLSSTRSHAEQTWALPENDPGVTSRPALEQAMRTDPSTAAYPLAFALEHGIEGQANYKRSIQLYTQAAEQGDIRAQSRLGIAYMKGQLGLPKSFDDANKWLTEAAIHNDLNAQYYLGQLLLHDPETSPVDALVWIAVAAKRGYEPAQNVIREHWAQLTQDQQDELVSRIHQWHVSGAATSVA